METSLHRQLKTLYAGADGECEVVLGQHRIDVVRRKKLYEIQHGSLSAIRRKVAILLESHSVVVVKPIVVDKRIVQLDRRDGDVVRRRMSPAHGKMLDLFDELVYFTRVFPHRRLTLEFPLVTVEETRYPGHGRRRRWRANDFIVADQRMVEMGESRQIRTAADLWSLFPPQLASPFDTAQLARHVGVPRRFAQRIAYCLLHCGAAVQVGKQGNARLFEAARAKSRRRTRAA